MRIFWLHLTDLFLAITELSQFGFLGLVNKEIEIPVSATLMRRHRALENALCTILGIGRIGRIGEGTRASSVDILQKQLYRL